MSRCSDGCLSLSRGVSNGGIKAGPLEGWDKLNKVGQGTIKSKARCISRDESGDVEPSIFGEVVMTCHNETQKIYIASDDNFPSSGTDTKMAWGDVMVDMVGISN